VTHLGKPARERPLTRRFRRVAKTEQRDSALILIPSTCTVVSVKGERLWVQRSNGKKFPALTGTVLTSTSIQHVNLDEGIDR